MISVGVATRDRINPAATVRWHSVAGEPFGNGLAVTPSITDSGTFTGLWTVVHVATGCAVNPHGGCIRCARTFATRLVETDVDWTESMDSMRPDRDEIRAAVLPHIEWFLLCVGGRCTR